MRSKFIDYKQEEDNIEGSKVLIAKVIAETSHYKPEFIRLITVKFVDT